MQSTDAKRPTNGGTDGDDEAIYRRARNETLLEIALVTSALLKQMLAVIDSTSKAIVMLPMSTVPGGDEAYDGYAECLTATSKIIVAQTGELTKKADEVARALSGSDLPEAQQHAESIKAALDLRRAVRD
jgi:hypothetical protein